MKPTLRIRWEDGRKSEIHVGKNLLSRVGALVRPLGRGKAIVLADRRLQKQARALERSLRSAGWEACSLTFAATEALKSYSKAYPVYGKLLQYGLDRQSVIFALGGGVIGDFSGFVAGTYLRGIRWVGVPSTLLAQVDSSVGGKTGVNHPQGKNLIGVFHQPSLVICDTALLSTLPARDRVSGIGEILKYGLAFDARLYHWLQSDCASLLELREPALSRAITASLRWKAKIVRADEYETRGRRHTLNLGHTMAHALEGATGFRHYRHGEAVLVGLRFAAALSLVRGLLPSKEYLAIDDFLASLPVPAFPRVTSEELFGYFKHDKKAQTGKVRFVLMRGIGKTVLDGAVEKADLAEAFRLMRAGEK